jgi:hypothetical protein
LHIEEIGDISLDIKEQVGSYSKGELGEVKSLLTDRIFVSVTMISKTII